MPELSSMERTIINAINSYNPNPNLEPGPGRREISAKAAVRRCRKAWQRVFDIELKKAIARSREDEDYEEEDAVKSFLSDHVVRSSRSAEKSDEIGSETGEDDHYERIFAAKAAGYAYRNAMPLLVGPEGIRNFVACIAHGILIGAIEKEQSGPLLYAAQVALGSIQRGTRSSKNTAVAARIPPPPLHKMSSIQTPQPLTKSSRES